MNILDLPEEIMIKILRILDTKSLFHAYNTCVHLKKLVGMHGVIQECKFSLSSLAEPDSLKSSFFEDIAGHLCKLDLSCMPNLNKMMLLNVAPKLSRLKILDVSYTAINLLDFIAIHQVCPTINDICINFDFGTPSVISVPTDKLKEYQLLFKNFYNVHFVGNLESLYNSNLPLALLQSAKIDKLQMTVVIDCSLPVYASSNSLVKMFECNQIIVYFLNWNKQAFITNFETFVLTSVLNDNKFEFILIDWINIRYRNVHASPIFRDFFEIKFNIQVQCSTDLAPGVLGGNAILMVWNKKSTVFDETFFNCLFSQLIVFFPHHYDEALNGTSVMPTCCDWLYVTQLPSSDAASASSAPESRYYSQVLDLDSITAKNKSLKLSILLKPNSRYVTLPLNGQYLQKLTYIDLNGLTRYAKDFFSILFTCCIKLQTFNMTFDHKAYNVIHDVTEALQFSKTLKNFRLVASHLQLRYIFVCLSKCRNLENIHLVDKDSAPKCVSSSKVIFEKCLNLYNMSITMNINGNVLKHKLHILHSLRLKYGRHHLNIKLNRWRRDIDFGYDPYIGVFNLCPLKPY